MEPSNYEAERQQNIQRNKDLLSSLGIKKVIKQDRIVVPSRKRKFDRITAVAGGATAAAPTRISARIASSTAKPRHASESPVEEQNDGQRVRTKKREVIKAVRTEKSLSPPAPPPLPEDVSSLEQGWTAWEAVAPEPTRDADGVFHFASHPTFQPNKSPAEILHEGAFGGGYFRPIWSTRLRMEVRDDYLDTVPEAWRQGLNVARFLTSEEYDAEVNKFGVACGQSIEEWEKSGWIRHEYDVRGWFQWYCRFFRGRRCDDDDRQVGRWDRCVGDKGRWRRTLLKRYIQAGIRSVMDEGLDDEDGEQEVVARGLSPVVHQTCHHWAYNVTQAALDRAWEGI
ncbi:MAG: hypothetical protein GOMPHAMPRED_006331 [Gomphillus americanus]|uniref:Vegetatible incompatibility protein HET-E-1 n=1 Tax=Gomphillus americanus TaxID=1940652 RepID=A0A8H3IA68_9LECA|nr:MAG: hypothetical protein GOMPHAMPRED_006331 [Gomphillus americanus]